MISQSLDKKSLLIGVFTFVFWGFAPIFFKLLESVPATVIIAHRVVWGSVFLTFFLWLREGSNFFSVMHISVKRIILLAFSGMLVVANWLVFVWAVNHGQIMATSLGYFINPLVNILLGMLFFSDRLTRVQWCALLLASIATFYLGFFIGEPPWIALMLGFSFGFYGLMRKKLNVRPLVGLLWETLVLLVPALLYILFFSPEYVFNGTSSKHSGLLVLSGLVTVLPLIGFNMAAKKLPLSIIGFLQYIAPTLSFLIAVLFYGEVFTEGHKVAFTGIWLALLLISIEPVYRRGLKKT